MMNFSPTSVIARKRDGKELSDVEIGDFVAEFTAGRVADYQLAALAMAIYLRGMTTRETAALTDAMLRSGMTLSWPQDAPPIVDKHSTGGVGDKVSLVLAPLLACDGLWIPMISGRGLGPTGGTLDKLEAIPGFRTNLAIDEFQAIVARVGCAIAGASERIAPADRKLYALRDVTATVASIPLITSSIMSKKLAEGLTALVLDVKCGSGAFMKTHDQASELASALANTGNHMGVATSAMITDMNQPLGRMIGNSVEVNEAVDALQGKGPRDLMAVTIALGADLLVATGRVASADAGSKSLIRHLESGRAWTKFQEMVEAQGGDIHAPREVAPATEFQAQQTGYIAAIKTEQLGQVVIELGGGRKVMTDNIDHGVGLEMLVKIGERVEKGQSLMRVFARPESLPNCQDKIATSVVIETKKPRPGMSLIQRLS